jgi:dCTP diphosphatase
MRYDSSTSLSDLRLALLQFRDQRDWAQFHDPKNLAEALSIESGELLQLFLWKDKQQIAEELKSSRKFKHQVEQELADVVCFALNLANTLAIDVSRVVMEKLKENRKKYPIAKSKGRATKYNQL